MQPDDLDFAKFYPLPISLLSQVLFPYVAPHYWPGGTGSGTGSQVRIIQRCISSLSCFSISAYSGFPARLLNSCGSFSRSYSSNIGRGSANTLLRYLGSSLPASFNSTSSFQKSRR